MPGLSIEIAPGGTLRVRAPSEDRFCLQASTREQYACSPVQSRPDTRLGLSLHRPGSPVTGLAATASMLPSAGFVSPVLALPARSAQPCCLSRLRFGPGPSAGQTRCRMHTLTGPGSLYHHRHSPPGSPPRDQKHHAAWASGKPSVRFARSPFAPPRLACYKPPCLEIIVPGPLRLARFAVP